MDTTRHYSNEHLYCWLCSTCNVRGAAFDTYAKLQEHLRRVHGRRTALQMLTELRRFKPYVLTRGHGSCYTPSHTIVCYSALEVTVPPFETVKVPLMEYIAIPAGYYSTIRIDSTTTNNSGWILPQSEYEKEITAVDIFNMTQKDITVPEGTPIGTFRLHKQLSFEIHNLDATPKSSRRRNRQPESQRSRESSSPEELIVVVKSDRDSKEQQQQQQQQQPKPPIVEDPEVLSVLPSSSSECPEKQLKCSLSSSSSSSSRKVLFGSSHKQQPRTKTIRVAAAAAAAAPSTNNYIISKKPSRIDETLQSSSKKTSGEVSKYFA